MDENELRELILSNEYLDIIQTFRSSPEQWTVQFQQFGAQAFGGGFGMVHVLSLIHI